MGALTPELAGALSSERSSFEAGKDTEEEGTTEELAEAEMVSEASVEVGQKSPAEAEGEGELSSEAPVGTEEERATEELAEAEMPSEASVEVGQQSPAEAEGDAEMSSEAPVGMRCEVGDEECGDGARVVSHTGTLSIPGAECFSVPAIWMPLGKHKLQEPVFPVDVEREGEQSCVTCPLTTLCHCRRSSTVKTVPSLQ